MSNTLDVQNNKNYCTLYRRHFNNETCHVNMYSTAIKIVMAQCIIDDLVSEKNVDTVIQNLDISIDLANVENINYKIIVPDIYFMSNLAKKKLLDFIIDYFPHLLLDVENANYLNQTFKGYMTIDNMRKVITTIPDTLYDIDTISNYYNVNKTSQYYKNNLNSLQGITKRNSLFTDIISPNIVIFGECLETGSNLNVGIMENNLNTFLSLAKNFITLTNTSKVIEEHKVLYKTRIVNKDDAYVNYVNQIHNMKLTNKDQNLDLLYNCTQFCAYENFSIENFDGEPIIQDIIKIVAEFVNFQTLTIYQIKNSLYEYLKKLPSKDQIAFAKSNLYVTKVKLLELL